MNRLQRLALGSASLVFSVLAVAGWTSPAPDVVVYCEPMLTHAMRDAASGYTKSSSVPVHVFQRPGLGLIALLQRTARDDVLVAGKATLDAAAAQKLVRDGSVQALGADPFVFISQDGTPGIANRGRLVLPDATTAATFDGRAVLAQARPGFDPANVVGVADTPEVVFTVQRDREAQGLAFRSDAIGAPHVRIAGLASVAATPIEAGLVTSGQSANAPAFLAYLTSDAGRKILQADGVGP